MRSRAELEAELAELSREVSIEALRNGGDAVSFAAGLVVAVRIVRTMLASETAVDVLAELVKEHDRAKGLKTRSVA